MRIIHQGNLAFVLSMITSGKSTGDIIEEAEERGIKIEVHPSSHWEPKPEPEKMLFEIKSTQCFDKCDFAHYPRELSLKQRHAPKGMQSPRKAKRKKP